MRAVILFLSILGFSIPSLAANVGRVFDVRGDVVAGATPVKLGGSVVSEHHYLTDGGAWMKARMADDSIVVVGEESDLVIDRYVFRSPEPGRDEAQYTLGRGSLRMVSGVMSKQRPGSVLLVTEFGSLTTVGTDYLAGICGSGCSDAPGLYVQVLQGLVKLTTTAGTVQILGTGQIVRVTLQGQVLAVASLPAFMAGLSTEDALRASAGVGANAIGPTRRLPTDVQDFLGGVIEDPAASPSEPPRRN